MSDKQLTPIPIDKIVVPDIRVSAKFDDEQRAFFRASIQKVGIIQDPVVRRLPDGRYEVIEGAHRIQEAKEQGMKEVLCKVVSIDDKTSIEMNLIANVARGDYDPMEISRQMQNYLKKGGTVDELVKLTGHSKDWVEKYLSLTQLPEEFQAGLSQGKLTIGHVEQAMRLEDPADIYDALGSAMTHRWPVSVMRNYVENRKAQLEAWRAAQARGLAPPEKPEPTPHLAQFADCWGCQRKVTLSQIRVPRLCQDCVELVQYCTQQLGEPRKAMDRIYESVSFKMRYDQWQQQQWQTFQQQQQQPPAAQTGPPMIVPPLRPQVKKQQEGESGAPGG